MRLCKGLGISLMLWCSLVCVRLSRLTVLVVDGYYCQFFFDCSLSRLITPFLPVFSDRYRLLSRPLTSNFPQTLTHSTQSIQVAYFPAFGVYPFEWNLNFSSSFWRTTLTSQELRCFIFMAKIFETAIVMWESAFWVIVI